MEKVARPTKKRQSKQGKDHMPLVDAAPSQSTAAEPSQSAPASAEPLTKKQKTDAKFMAKRRALQQGPESFGEPAGPDGAVVYLGHIPHGFYEEQMRSFFGQFGTVCRLRLARNTKARPSNPPTLCTPHVEATPWPFAADRQVQTSRFYRVQAQGSSGGRRQVHERLPPLHEGASAPLPPPWPCHLIRWTLPGRSPVRRCRSCSAM